MNRRQNKDSDTGRFILVWIVATLAIMLLMYWSVEIARQEGMNGDLKAAESGALPPSPS